MNGSAMEGPQKLSRSASPLLRSQTFRSSSYALSALSEEPTTAGDEQQKPLRRASTPRAPRAGAGARPVLQLFCLGIFSVLLLFFYLRSESPLYRNIFLASVASTIAFVIARRARIARLGRRLRRSGSVRWFIGDEEDRAVAKKASSSKKPDLEGVEILSNGDVYEGELHNGKCNGSGVYNFFSKGRYEGDWVDGKYDGYGVESWARGSRYRGQFRHGLRHGLGVYRFHNGDAYAGEWQSGQSHGIGMQTCSDGSSYVGEFKCGAKHGRGCYHFRNGDRYRGEYFADKMHGFGVYEFANGHCYEGSWHEGRRQGFGSYAFRNGDSKSGEWDRGVLKIALLLSDPCVDRAVQAARKAAENATLLPSIEDQVGKAVAAANRAAMAARVAAIKAVQNHMGGKFCDSSV